MFVCVDAHVAAGLAVIYTFVVGNGRGFQEETLPGRRFDGVAADEVAVFVDASHINVLIGGCGLRNDGEKAECDEGEKTERAIHEGEVEK